MILLDTHIWVWWVQGDNRLTQQHQVLIQAHQTDELGISVYSCWEVAKLVEYGRLILPCSLEEWFATALAYPGIQLLDLTLPIIVESTRLTGFHKDPADQLIVATARVLGLSLLTIENRHD
ncbi:MAG: type II toxin-antitoxin system VapC family toxin [Oscillatoriales cyanobacterium RU_3_3]|nr:type II toxin-antitoxin system VapC family toxin [Oscillatoriales cyanobacterium RU_3_3]NJR21234.1 type II toxin-antitoxin system VapC family toxin [Richelia sp. CSU_2_1]